MSIKDWYSMFLESIDRRNSIKFTLEELENINEANITIGGKKGTDSVIYVRTAVQTTSGSSISKDGSEGKMNHAESIKLKFDNKMIPIEIFSGKANLKTELYNGNKAKELKDKKKQVEKFINKNIDDIKAIYNSKGTDTETQIKLLKSIIDRSGNEIKDISAVPKEVNDYLKEFKNKKKGI